MHYFFCLLLLMKVGSKSHGTRCEKGCDGHEELKLTACTNALFTQLPKHIPPYTQHLNLSMNLLTFIPKSSFQMERKLRVLLIKDNNISAVADGAFTQLEFLQNFSWPPTYTILFCSILLCYIVFYFIMFYYVLFVLFCCVVLCCVLFCSILFYSIQVRSFGSMSTLRQLHLEDNHLVSLNNGVFSTLKSLEVLNLTIYFKTFLSIHTYSTHIMLEGNPWNCNCDLQKVFHKLRSVQRLILDDYYNLSCNAPTELANYRLMDVDTELCIAEIVIVLIITITVVITVLGAIVMVERKRKKKKGESIGRSRVTCLTQITRD
uniref:LRRCT domain-containing protein n=1 Tax=Hucho hucho TaxID=62062 RepID=A0A4W5NL87_9TELE